nr:MAG TPA: hypothetical protein [Caudoviricetes sp.]
MPASFTTSGLSGVVCSTLIQSPAISKKRQLGVVDFIKTRKTVFPRRCPNKGSWLISCAISNIIASSFLLDFPRPLLNSMMRYEEFASLRVYHQQFSAPNVLIKNRDKSIFPYYLISGPDPHNERKSGNKVFYLILGFFCGIYRRCGKRTANALVII